MSWVLASQLSIKCCHVFCLRKTAIKNLTYDSISLKSHTISNIKSHFKCAKFVHITLQRQT
ncbi:hypothetical protein CPS_0012 [Colwellia psychrerythraea 34H]|uniref:Uncharacterized protein n=1 Tax=Colwellia psychrerythraea (strain 34H / ATCC BAA-681) TaxID=167879 RepID=Q48AT6_COLP3|nr:hypothetical protein CPS_0012 [Colwellia psychrerythraea 34H]